MIEVLRLGPSHGWHKLRAAIGQAVSLGCWDGEAVRYLLLEDRLERAEPEAIEAGLLERFERPLPPIGEYDQLLAAEVRP